jgi:hypothetical protein
MLTGTISGTSLNTNYSIIVGAGGAGGVGGAGPTDGVTGTRGSNSSVISITTIGGGGGGAYSAAAPTSGGSGGGAGTWTGAATGGAGTTGQGNAGGAVSGAANSPPYAGSGGGGAGGVGQSANPGNGGIGLQSNITGTVLYYAGGGGGGGNSANGSGGLGGGAPGKNGTGAALSGNTNTGGGGGGGGSTQSGPGGAGGSGVVILRHPSNFANATTTGANVTSANGYTVYTFNQSGTINFLPEVPYYSNVITVTTTQDPSFANVTMLLNGNGAGPNTYIQDNSSNNQELIVYGDTRATDFHPYAGNYYSTYFNGSSYLTAPSNAALTLGTSDFTVEAWVNLTGTQTTTYGWGIIGTYPGSSTGWSITINRTSGATYGIIWIIGGAIVASYTTSYIPVGIWTHIAITRSGSGSNNTKIFLNGALVTQATDNTNDTYSGVTYLGSQGAGQYFPGYISNARVVKGTALYTGTFTPSTTPLTAVSGTSLLACQTPNLKDNSTNNFAVTGSGSPTVTQFVPFASVPTNNYGSAYFDGSGDYILTPSSSIHAMNTGDFTYEAWVYPTAYTSISLFMGNPGGGTSGLQAYLDGTGQLVLSTVNAGFGVAHSLIPGNTWTHVAISCISGTMKTYVNGTLGNGGVASTSQPYTLNGTTSCVGGTGSYYFSGYVSDYRVTKGTGLYTGNFTPPTAPVSPLSSSSLLTLQNRYPTNNHSFRDESTAKNLITRYGNASQGSFNPYAADGSWSNYFNSTSDYLFYPDTANFGTNDFTVECWLYATNSNHNCFYSSSPANNWGFLTYSNQLYWQENGGNLGGAGYGTVPTNQWVHLAASRTGGNLNLYINGIRVYTVANSYNYSASGYNRTLGPTGGGNSVYYISNVRFIRGFGIYSGTTITVPTASLTAIAGTTLLTCQSPSYTDNGPLAVSMQGTGAPFAQKFSPFNNYLNTPQSYSTKFNGSTDYLTAPSNAAFQFGTGAFTMEAWVYPTATAAAVTQWIMNNIDSASGTTQCGLSILASTNKLLFQTWNTVILTSTAAISLNVWTHVALSFDGTTYKMFINGALDTSGTSLTNFSSAGTAKIGYALSGNSPFTGYISNARIVKGTAVYTSAFTPPTSPLTAISGTSLLTCQNATIVDNSTNAFALTVAGTPIPKVFNPFGSTTTRLQTYQANVFGGSTYFDGTGDYLTAFLPGGLGNGDFTVEGWVYFTAGSPGNNGVFHISTGSYLPSNSTGLALAGASTNWHTYRAGAAGTQTGPAIVSGQWYHFAFCRRSGSLKLFINGEQNQATFSDSTDYTSASYLSIGGYYSTAYLMTGYVSGFRVIRGQALYFDPFVPPPSPSLPVANTAIHINMTNAAIYDTSMATDIETVGDARISTVVKKIGSASMYFDGTGDYLTSSSNPAFAFGTGDFTIECWFYSTSISNTFSLIDMRNPDTGNAGWDIMFTTSRINFGTAGATYITGTTTLSNNTWYHAAVTRSGNSFKMFLNGVQEGSTYTGSSTQNFTNSILKIGAGAQASAFSGYIDDLRITKGLARYTATFTPSTIEANDYDVVTTTTSTLINY